eukprot:g2841.t1
MPTTQSKENGAVKKKKRKRTNPIYTIFWKLFPFQFFNNGKDTETNKFDQEDATLGRLEVIMIFLVSCMRTWHQNRMVYVKRDLMTVTFTRNLDAFRNLLFDAGWMSLLASAIFSCHRYLKERLASLWREKLTKQLHRRYFHAMGYYKLSHLNKQAIPDVSERMVKDPRRFTKALADEMEKISAGITSGIWFTYKLYTISSPLEALSPLIYMFICWNLSLKVTPDWSRKWRNMLDLRSKYVSTQSRLQVHSEAICAYQGNKVERAIINNSWENYLEYVMTYVRDASIFQFVTKAFFEYGGNSICELLILIPFYSPANEVKQNYLAEISNAKALGGAEASNLIVKANAALMGAVRYRLEYYIRCFSAQGVVISGLRQLMQMRGPAKRLTQLYDTLDKFIQEKRDSTQFVDTPDTIGFENVQVFTPTNNLLIKDLNFKIKRGTNMLLTGCNGSGKSSIFRCLGGLWSIPEGGRISKPGGNSVGLNAAVFYLPQKPYNVLGTLRDQLCYPENKRVAKKISDGMLRKLLKAVDLEYLIDRGPQGPKDDKEVNWEVVLSMGEKQRLAMARLFYHNPKFAILDECTSGVSAAMERKLYDACGKRNITCITISHRPVLEQYHDYVLNVLKDGKGGYTWRETLRQKNKMHKKRSASILYQDQVVNAGNDDGYKAWGGVSKAYLQRQDSDAAAEEAFLAKRSEKYKDDSTNNISKSGKKIEMKTKHSTWKRLFDVLYKGYMPNGFVLSDKETWRIIGLAGLIMFKVYAADRIARLDGAILATVLGDSRSNFAYLWFLGAFFRTFLAGFDAIMIHQKWALNLEWRRRLTKYMMDLYFTRNTFYDVKNQDSRITDPEERLTEQIEELSRCFTQLWTEALAPFIDIFYNAFVLYRAVGFRAVSSVGAWMIGGGLLLRYVIPNFRENVRKMYKLEGRFRFVHNRLVTHTESVAFFGGDQVENEVVDEKFKKLKEHISMSQIQNLRFNLFNNFMIRQTPDLMSFALRMYYAMTFVTDKSVANSGGEISSTGEYVQQTVIRTFKSYGDMFDLQETLGNFTGLLENVTDTMYVLEELAMKQKQNMKSTKLESSNDDSIAFKEVDIVAPGGVCCASDLTVKIEQGSPLIVTGPNASGKSSLFRTLGGLWPIPTGKIQRPCNPDGVVTTDQVFLVPQKPYSVTGSLCDQITYPKKLNNRTAQDEKKLLSLLTLVGIPYLVEREGGWDTIQQWENVLSLGEQERMGCARLFYHNPKFAILDECTSAVSIDVEEKLYRAANERGITSITISQRLALEEFHTRELRMGDCEGEKGWSIRMIDEGGGDVLEEEEEED